MLNDVAINVQEITKTFKLPHEKHASVKSAFINFYKRKKGYEKQQVLNGVSFEVKKGEFFGIVGRNGSGKSTLLKLLAGIYTPDSGDIKVSGKLTPFIELGVGFNPELSGRENVFLNGALLGFNRKEMEVMYDEIVAFAELERFMDQKLKNYSSGMQVRLAFSIAIRANTDILVLDEVLAVGDEAFQKKCYQYFAQLKKNKKTVILVTHDMDAVQRFCDKAVIIEKGNIITEGNPAKVAQGYRELFMGESIVGKTNKNHKKEQGNNLNKQPIDITATLLRSEKTIKMNVKLLPKENIEDSIVSLFLDRDTGEQVYRFSSDEKIGRSFNLRKNKPININLEIQDIFPNGIFTLRASVKSRDRAYEYASVGDLAEFEVDRRVGGVSEWDIHWQPNEKYTIE